MEADAKPPWDRKIVGWKIPISSPTVSKPNCSGIGAYMGYGTGTYTHIYIYTLYIDYNDTFLYLSLSLYI